MMRIPLILAALLMAGCVHVKYGEASYSRLGNMAVEDVKIVTPEGMDIHIGKSNAETHIGEAARDIAAAARSIAGAGVAP